MKEDESSLVIKKVIFLFIFFFSVFSCKNCQNKESRSYRVETYFSPFRGCTDAIVRSINNAKESIYMEAYAFTNKKILDALIAAKKRKIRIECIIDSTYLWHNFSKILFKNVDAFYTNTNNGLQHNKVFIIDDNVVITGSFNFSNGAENKNLENLVIFYDKDVSKKFLEEWSYIRNNYATLVTQDMINKSKEDKKSFSKKNKN